ncbi:short chain dehydrogenase reductase family [Colletotrichum asianum]|uniref:Short chain dehydrogenase reductase family n=1 Tax=Colletotrichum asianum TaxID=702518 RepID=A0A8H3ZQX3_9PEZI|nr:short chain dehydrogenase reductase family [Colletotrichum asianum]
MSNTAGPEFREMKERQGGAHIDSRDLFRLDNRTIIITGGAGYLGVEAAGCILDSGGDVVCLDVVEKPRTEVWNQLLAVAQKHDRLLSYYFLDVTNTRAISTVFETLVPH